MKPSKTKKSAKKKSSKSIDSALLDRLVQDATAVRENAYAPYSKYKVGAAIATKSGAVFTGCNVENATYGATICAERGAVMKMIAAGEKNPIAVAVVTKDGGSPCGICRQVLAEFADDLPIALASAEKERGKVVSLKELLPLAFKLRR